MNTLVCAYCGDSSLSDDDPVEHIIPAAIGGRLTTRGVCAACNAWAGREVDQPFLDDDWVRIHRDATGVVDRRHRGKPSRNPLLSGFDETGRFVEIGEDARPVIGGSIEDHETHVTVSAGTIEEAERLKARALKRFGISDDAPLSIERTFVRPTISISVKVDLAIWLRMAAKIALGASAVAYPPHWRLSDDANTLRRILRGEVHHPPGSSQPGLFPTTVEPKGIGFLAAAGEHVIYFSRLSDSRNCINVVLFGCLYFALPIDSGEFETPGFACWMDIKSGSYESSTWDELLLRAVDRFADFERL